MKVLHLPTNIASQISISVRALRALGVEARGLVRKTSVMQDYSGVKTVEWSGRVGSARRLVRGIRWRLEMVRAMAWADVIHWHWGESLWKGTDLRLAARLVSESNPVALRFSPCHCGRSALLVSATTDPYDRLQNVVWHCLRCNTWTSGCRRGRRPFA